MPPTDLYQGTVGRGDAYASFVINNVRPYIDTTFRTLNDPANTLVGGSSLGGLISLYFGREHSTFGKIAVMSPAFWIAPNYVTLVRNGAKKPLRVYLDFGTSEPAADWDNCLDMHDIHLSQSYAANADLKFVGGCGQSHNEAAWSARFPQTLQYLLPAREEPAQLALRDFPPKVALANVDVSARHTTMTYTSLFGFAYVLERSADLANWSVVSTSSPESLPWTSRPVEDNPFPANIRYWRMRAVTP
jgi:hypothetical protein